MSTRCSCLDRTDSNKLHRRFHMDCIEGGGGGEGIHFADDFPFSREAMIPRDFQRLDRRNKLSVKDLKICFTADR